MQDLEAAYLKAATELMKRIERAAEPLPKDWHHLKTLIELAKGVKP